MLLDEPMSAMDERTRLDVRTTLREHLRQFDGPVIVVTHDPLEAMVMADRLLVLAGGRVVQVGTPTEVARRPVTDYVARLVGLNLYAGRVSDGQVALDQGGRLVVAGHEHHGERVLVAIRPASVGVHARQPVQASPRNVWAGTVAGLEPLGDRVRVQVEGDPDELVDVTPAAVADLALRPGRSVWVSVKATDLEVYPESLAAG
jgi:molybdate transport system ATP-binding protein